MRGRLIAAETKYATPQAALNTTGCARYTVALCDARPTRAWIATKSSASRARVPSRPLRICQTRIAPANAVAASTPAVRPHAVHAP
jgi:hypothetical protein